MSPSSSSRFLPTAIVLGLISAIGPFAIDMYLPALPSIGASLGASDGAVQMSLTAFFIAMAVGQVVYGPLSDMWGRKRPLYIGLVLFAVASIGCGLARNIETLITLRFVQGVGACAGLVVPRAVVRDMHTGPEAARLMSLLMLVFSVSPMLAPLTGSALIQLSDWRAVFWAVTFASVVGLAIVALLLDETRPPEARLESNPRQALAGYRVLLTDPIFMGLSLIGAFGVASFFVYLANSSFVMIGHFGLTPRQYSIAFSMNALAFIGVAQANGWLARRFGLRRIVTTALTGYTLVMLVLCAVTLLGVDRLDVLLGGFALGFACLGLVIPTTAVMAMDEHGAIAGSASALLGTLQSVVGAAMIALVGPFADGTQRPMVVGVTLCAIIALVLARLTLARRPAPVPAAAE